jgi:hypothetical protein
LAGKGEVAYVQRPWIGRSASRRSEQQLSRWEGRRGRGEVDGHSDDAVTPIRLRCGDAARRGRVSSNCRGEGAGAAVRRRARVEVLSSEVLEERGGVITRGAD